MKISHIGEGKVYLIAGGTQVYADIAARFVKSERPVEEIIESPYSPDIIRNLLGSNHLAALEFDYYIFGVEGYSRVCETQLVRKRHASYMIKSGRVELGGKREFSLAMPAEVDSFAAEVKLPDGQKVKLSGRDLAGLTNQWYMAGLEAGLPEESLRYLKQQATEFRAIIGMNAHALYDFFAVRCCMNAQAEIRDMANKMLALCRDASPDLFAKAGPNCVRFGRCTEGKLQNKACRLKEAGSW